MIEKVSQPLNNANLSEYLLAQTISSLRPQSHVFYASQMAAPWGIDYEISPLPRFHCLLEGQAYIGIKGQDPISIKAGDLVLLAAGVDHWVADKNGRALTPCSAVRTAWQEGTPLFQSQNNQHYLISGLFKTDHPSLLPFLHSMVPLRLYQNLKSHDSMRLLAQLIRNEMSAVDDRMSLIADRLAEVLFVKLLSYQFKCPAVPMELTSNTHLRRIHKAIAIIHRQPLKPWSLDQLGKQVGMSAPTLVRHFKRHLGIAPMAYITQWRLNLAYSQMELTHLSIDEVALNAGYQSNRSFSRAFERQFGITPSARYRQLAGQWHGPASKKKSL